MKKTTNKLSDLISDEEIIRLPADRKRGKSIDEFINKTVGEPGTEKREKFESELTAEIESYKNMKEVYPTKEAFDILDDILKNKK